MIYKMDLPVDIWWKIFQHLWSGKDFNLNTYGKNNPYVSKDIAKYKKTIGISITADLFMFRRLCKTTKRMVEKYTKRYQSHLTKNYMIAFRYPEPLYKITPKGDLMRHIINIHDSIRNNAIEQLLVLSNDSIMSRYDYLHCVSLQPISVFVYIQQNIDNLLKHMVDDGLLIIIKH